MVVSGLMLSVTLRAEDPIVKGQANWQFLDTGETPPADWVTADFDDSEWSQGKAPLGYGESEVATAVSFGEDRQDKHAGSFFRLRFDVQDPSAYPHWLLQMRCDDGALVFLNENEVFRYNMNLGMPTAETFSASKLSSSLGKESRYHRVQLNPDELLAGENVIAVSVHQADPGSSDLFLDVSLRGIEESELPELKRRALDHDGTLDDQRVAEYIGKHAKAQIATQRHALPGRWRAGLERETLSAMMPLIEAPLEELTPEEIYQKCAPSVLIISGINDVDNEHGQHAGGFVISASGLAVTNYHVVESFMDADLITATTLDGRVASVLRVVASDEADDVAVLQLDGDGFHPVPIAPKPGVGADVVAISHPSNEFFCLTRGYVTRFSREGEKRRPRMMITADFAAGSSGAPVFDKHGAVIGMVEMTRSVAYNKVPLHSAGEDQALKLGEPEGRRRSQGLFLSMNHQMTLKYCIPSEAILSFLKSEE